MWTFFENNSSCLCQFLDFTNWLTSLWVLKGQECLFTLWVHNYRALHRGQGVIRVSVGPTTTTSQWLAAAKQVHRYFILIILVWSLLSHIMSFHIMSIQTSCYYFLKQQLPILCSKTCWRAFIAFSVHNMFPLSEISKHAVKWQQYPVMY